MIGNYCDLALLDLVEHGDGGDNGPGATIDVVDHRGRQAWEAGLRPTPAYDPLCPYCPLLLSNGCSCPTFVRQRSCRCVVHAPVAAIPGSA